MSKSVIRELVTLWSFDIDGQPLKEVNAGINVIKSSLKGLAISVAASAAAIGVLLNEAGEDEQTRVAFETMLGSAEAMEQKLKELDDFATKTPFTLVGIRKNTRLLLGMGISADNLLPTLKSLGDVAAGLSIPLERLALNYGQVRSQQKLTGRELRDFAIAGVPLLEELAKNLGKTTAQVQKMVSSGSIGFKDVEKAFETMTSGSGKFADLMIKQSKTFFGLLSNVKDIIQIIARDLGNEMLPEAKRIVTTMMDLVTANKELIKTNLREFLKNTAEFMGTLFDMSMSLFKSMTGIVDIFGGWNKVLKITSHLITVILALGFTLGVGLMTKAVGMLVIALWLKVAAITADIIAMQSAVGMSITFKSALIALGDSAMLAQAKLMLIPLAIGAIAIAMGLIAEDIFAFSQGRDSVFGRMIAGLDVVNDHIKEKMGGLGTFLEIFLAAMLTPVRGVVAAIRSIGAAIDVVSGKKTLLEGIKAVGSNLGGIFSPFAGDNTARSLFNLSENAGVIDETVAGGTGSAIAGLGGNPFTGGGQGQKAVTVESKNEINLNLEGMPVEAAKELVVDQLTGVLDGIMRGAVRDGESSIER